MQALAMLDDTKRLLALLVRDDFHTPRFPESCPANLMSALLCEPTFFTEIEVWICISVAVQLLKNRMRLTTATVHRHRHLLVAPLRK